MKLCDLTQFYSPYSGGVKRYIHEKIRFIQSQSDLHEHILIVPGETTQLTVGRRTKTYTIRSPLISQTSRYRVLWKVAAVEEILFREKPDLIESGDPYQMAWKAASTASYLQTASVGFYHSHFPEAYVRSTLRYFGETATDLVMDVAQRYIQALYNRFDRTLVPSVQLAEVLQLWGVRNVQPIDLGVDTNVFQPNPERRADKRRELGVDPDTCLLLYVGRLAPEKNTSTLIRAFEILIDRFPGRYRLVVVGDGSLGEKVGELSAESGCVSWIRYIEDPEKLADIYRAADLFVHPGVQETFGLVTLESQSSGTPVVGIRGSYMDRLIFGGFSHWAEENSPDSLASAISEICLDDLQAIGLQSAAAVGRKYSWNVVFARLFKIYRELVDKYHPRS